jgi:reactive intermediate/imine deaminase
MKNAEALIKKFTPIGFPPPVGAFSHGVLVPLAGADMLFVTGQVAVDGQNNVIAPNDAGKQAEAVFERIGKILAEVGFGFQDVVKAQIFLTNIKDFPAVSQVRNKYFAESRPAGTLLEVSKLVREGCCVEIEVVAVRLHSP